jgi:hypothetical protein
MLSPVSWDLSGYMDMDLTEAKSAFVVDQRQPLDSWQLCP